MPSSVIFVHAKTGLNDRRDCAKCPHYMYVCTYIPPCWLLCTLRHCYITLVWNMILKVCTRVTPTLQDKITYPSSLVLPQVAVGVWRVLGIPYCTTIACTCDITCQITPNLLQSHSCVGSKSCVVSLLPQKYKMHLLYPCLQGCTYHSQNAVPFLCRLP